MSAENSNDLPVTGALLSLIQAISGARMMYLSEGLLARDLGMPEPSDYCSRCKELFEVTYSEQCRRIGLKRNRITFEAIMRLSNMMNDIPIWSEMLSVNEVELPSRYVFNPWRGFRVVEVVPCCN